VEGELGLGWVGRVHQFWCVGSVAGFAYGCDRLQSQRSVEGTFPFDLLATRQCGSRIDDRLSAVCLRILVHVVG
jgi:hypothetical protein